ncbi:MAG: hypothetical protein QW350_05145 [Candidatus Aenigmatarchaeota archaeon]|jgi:hypothetical protein
MDEYFGSFKIQVKTQGKQPEPEVNVVLKNSESNDADPFVKISDIQWVKKPPPIPILEKINLHDLLLFFNTYPIFSVSVELIFLTNYSKDNITWNIISPLGNSNNLTLKFTMPNNGFPEFINITLNPSKSFWDVVEFEGIMNWRISIKCEKDILENRICYDKVCLCNSENSCLRCLENFLNYCFPSNIISSPFCKNYVQDYYNFVGASENVEEKINEFCRENIKDITDFLNNSEKYDEFLVKLCACHLPSEFYQNILTKIDQVYPGVINLGIKPPCFVRQCVNSPIFNSVLGNKNGCIGPQCVNIIHFRSDGTFDNTNVKIEQKSECQIGGDTGNTGNTGNFQPIDPSKVNKIYVVIISGLIIFIIIIFIILIIVVRKKGG